MKPTDEQFEQAYKMFNGNRTEMAHHLGCGRGTAWRWCRAFEKKPKTSTTNSSVVVEVREVRKTDRRIEQLEADLAAERHRREVAESDLQNAEEALSTLIEVGGEVDGYTVVPKPRNPNGNGTAIICATDWHLEKRIVPSTVSDLNEFNLEIAHQRISNLWSKSAYLIDFWRQIGGIEEVILWLGGDLIQNYLRDEDRETNLLGPTEAVALLQEHIATGIDFLQHNVAASLKVVANVGNHSRTTRYMQQATSWKHSWEWLAYVTCARMFPMIPFTIAEGYFNYVDVQGYRVRFHHGEAVRYNGGVGGLQIPMNKAIAQWDKAKRSDFSINGHYHTYKDEWTWTSCGCLCGYDAFAQSIKADFQPPTQTLVIIDRERGKVASLPIFVE